MKLEQYRTMWGLIDETDGHLARSPHRTFDQVHPPRRALAHAPPGSPTIGCTHSQVIPELAALGYDGIEIPLKLALHVGIEKVKAALADHNLKCTVMIFTDGVVCPGAPGLWGGPYEGFTEPTAAGESDKEKMVATHLQAHEMSRHTRSRACRRNPALHYSPCNLCLTIRAQVFKEQVTAAYELLKPTLIVSHSLKDYFTYGMAEQFFTEALRWEEVIAI